jgi:hypothetical protein
VRYRACLATAALAVALAACGGRAATGTLEVQSSARAHGTVLVHRGGRIVLQVPLRRAREQLPPGRYYVSAGITAGDPGFGCRGRFVIIQANRRTSVAVAWKGGPQCTVQVREP